MVRVHVVNSFSILSDTCVVNICIQVALFITLYSVYLRTDTVVNYLIWCCFNTDSAVHYLDRVSVVHYLICCMFGQSFCSLSDTVNV
jgi:hypothetical protein